VEEFAVSDRSLRATISLDQAATERPEPDVVALAQIGWAPVWPVRAGLSTRPRLFSEGSDGIDRTRGQAGQGERANC
jgi:hypothetical protein